MIVERVAFRGRRLTIICLGAHADALGHLVANPTIRYRFTPSEGNVRYSALVPAAPSFNASVDWSKTYGSARREYPKDIL